jgi:hypothetical protein
MAKSRQSNAVMTFMARNYFARFAWRRRNETRFILKMGCCTNADSPKGTNADKVKWTNADKVKRTNADTVFKRTNAENL